MAKRKSLHSVDPSATGDGPIRPEPAPRDGAPPLTFHRGGARPKAIAWFGFRSFWGHLWSLLASGVATEDIDSRDWMRPDEPLELLRRASAELGGDPFATSLTEALGRDVWIDFLADTGDDVSVSAAVARMLFETYAVADASAPGGERTLPRGDLLIFGGDTAYPVATEAEIHDRVIVPFNRVLRERVDGRPRVLLGLPGNHDWFAGLDGFGRMFRKPLGQVDRASRVDVGAAGDAPPPPRGARLLHFFEWVEALRIGGKIEKRGALPLLGYAPVQSASYWALPLAPALDLWGPDRQLTTLDTRQRVHFSARREEADHGLFLCLADPPYAFLAPHRAGQEILASLDLAFERDGILALTGDIHHYCRLELAGGGKQVTAGGGGAFLHPARAARNGLIEPAAEFPGRAASRSLTAQIPVSLALGRAGLMLHAALAIAYGPMQKIAWTDGQASPTTALVTGLVLWVVLTAVAATRGPGAWKVVGLAALAAAALAGVPFGMNAAATALGPAWPLTTASLIVVAFVVAIFAGVFVIGVYLMILTILGLATDQGFGALAHPGYKHFVRLRIVSDGSRVEGWVLGKVDTLGPDEKVVLVDSFVWQNPRAVRVARDEDEVTR